MSGQRRFGRVLIHEVPNLDVFYLGLRNHGADAPAFCAFLAKLLLALPVEWVSSRHGAGPHSAFFYKLHP